MPMVGVFDNGALPMFGAFGHGALAMFGAFVNGALPMFGAFGHGVLAKFGAFVIGALPMFGAFGNGALPMFGAFDNGAPPRFGADAMLLDGAWTGAAARNLLGFEEVDGEGDEVRAIKPEGSIRLLICTTDMVLFLSATSRTTTAWSEPAAETIEIVSPFVMFTKPCWPLGSSVTWSSVFIRVGCETGKLWNFWTV
ncbi:uncharacterized protein LOC117623043 isoform X2 [Prunus dulcis]|nr:uncharacterized protein LOC117623043 isoform X2 [Prunus dulcis]